MLDGFLQGKIYLFRNGGGVKPRCITIKVMRELRIFIRKPVLSPKWVWKLTLFFGCYRAEYSEGGEAETAPGARTALGQGPRKGAGPTWGPRGESSVGRVAGIFQFLIVTESLNFKSKIV